MQLWFPSLGEGFVTRWPRYYKIIPASPELAAGSSSTKCELMIERINEYKCRESVSEIREFMCVCVCVCVNEYESIRIKL